MLGMPSGRFPRSSLMCHPTLLYGLMILFFEAVYRSSQQNGLIHVSYCLRFGPHCSRISMGIYCGGIYFIWAHYLLLANFFLVNLSHQKNFSHPLVFFSTFVNFTQRPRTPALGWSGIVRAMSQRTPTRASQSQHEPENEAEDSTLIPRPLKALWPTC